MKGIVFTEFLDLVEEKFGLGMVDQIIEQSELPSNGVYTSIGTYSFAEMLQLIQNLSANTGLSIDQLLLAYGEHFFNVIENSYPGLLATYKDPIEMLSSIENHIHIEVRKIYPDAELPTFEVLEKSDQHLVMIYMSSRAMHHFGLGLMNRTFAHFEMTSNIQIEKIKEDGTEVKFTIHKT
ncbi:heme NO-binding domain-containing protein [Nonlabens ulvanivorans]|uniref:Heme transporter CcmB n=1 Tax=Nonlabens ulvanivorans TaxID=906888 RepID=A0A084JTM7_NONUL|nr:heme NO-binding domain-containing protein [Nonlabens ulvanivorans]KEZ92311.1 heme transporter CcmB [Nonlabens ulvanivorans]PRX15144.1 heme-NO-binding protein [Nonlabens ulvanivorans]